MLNKKVILGMLVIVVVFFVPNTIKAESIEVQALQNQINSLLSLITSLQSQLAQLTNTQSVLPTPTPIPIPTPVPPVLDPIPTPRIDANIVSFINNGYFLILNRKAENKAIKNWGDKLSSQSLSYTDFLWKLINSKEFTDKNTDKITVNKLSSEDYIRLLYVKILHRKPDSAGLKNWESKLKEGLSRKDLFKKILFSAESKKKNQRLFNNKEFRKEEHLLESPISEISLNGNLVSGLDFLGGIKVIQTFPVAQVEVDRWFPFGQEDTKKSNIWRLSQWHSKYDIAKAQPLNNTDGSITYSNEGKSITFNKDKSFILEIKGKEEYGNEIGRKSGESWPHLLLAQSLLPLKEKELPSSKNNVNHDKVKYLGDLDELRFKLKYKIIDRSAVPTGMNTRTQTIQDVVTLIVQDRNPKSNTYGDIFWFNMMLHDARYGCTPELKKGDDFSAKFIYEPSSCKLFPAKKQKGVITNAPWVNIDKDILPYIKKGFNEAQKRGYLKGVSFNDLALDQVSIGYEATAAINMKSQYKDLQFIAINKNTKTADSLSNNMQLASVIESFKYFLKSLDLTTLR